MTASLTTEGIAPKRMAASSLRILKLVYSKPEGAPEDDTIRKLLCHIAALEQRSAHEPRDKSGVTISGNDLKEALAFIAPDGTPEQLKCDVRIEWGQNGHSGPGYYCFDVEYPDEGSIILGPEGMPDEPSSADISNARVAETHNGLAGAFKARDRMKAELAAERLPLTKEANA